MQKLHFSNVSLTYNRQGELLQALEGLLLDVHAGESVALIGPSGCGKSSLLRMAAGLLSPATGEVLVDGEPLKGPRAQTALILQDFGLLPWKTVLGNAELGLAIRHVPRAQRSRSARTALEMVGLGEFVDAYPESLSGGMKQRLALARALTLNVDLLLMDEPLSALDALLREQMQDMLLDLWQRAGYAQVLVTHSIEEAVFLGQRIFVMSPRPGRVMGVFDNPGVGTAGHRSSEAYFTLCNVVRECLHRGMDEKVPHA